MSATATERDILQCAYYWADNPTSHDAKKALYDAVHRDRKASEVRARREMVRRFNGPEGDAVADGMRGKRKLK
jgi:hypothetical protein